MTSLTTPHTTTGDTGDPAERIERTRRAAYRIRRNALDMGEVQGQGYIGQALGVADILALVYTDQLRYRPEGPHGPARARFLRSIGHYAIALYAALAEAGIIPAEELSTYGSDDSRLPMSGMASYTPGMEISGGSPRRPPRHGDLRRLARPRPRRRHRHGPGPAPPGQSGAGVQPALRRRARRGLHLGGGDGLRPPRPGQRDRDRRRQRTAARRPPRRGAAHRAGHRQVAGLRLARPARRRQRRARADRRLRRTSRAPRLTVGAHLRHPHRLRRAPAREPGEGPLHAGRSPRMADRP